MDKSYINPALDPLERARDLLSKMTIQEKIGQLNQRLYGFSIYNKEGEEVSFTEEFKEEVNKYSGLGFLYGLFRADPWSKRDYLSGLDRKTAVKAYNKLQRYVIENSRLGIPALITTECSHGHQALDGYLLPVALAAGATFNPPLLEEAYRVCGEELKETGAHIALVSMLDILRDPRWGRSEEAFSEDPFLASRLAEAVIRGIQSTGVAVVAKHYCAQGEGTGGINASAARIGERELREIHIPAVKAACRAGVKGIMAAYNEIDGVPCHSNRWLIKKLLREELSFKGIVMADGTAIDRLDLITGDNVFSGALALKAGVDVSLWDSAFSRLEEALKRNLITEEDINDAVIRVLTLKFSMGLFDDPYILEELGEAKNLYEEFPYSQEMSRESVVLLKNQDKLLPLNHGSIKKIAVIGPNGDDLYNQLGDYTPPVRQEDGVTVLQGIKSLLVEEGSTADVIYHRGCHIYESKENDSLIEEAIKASEDCDYIILVLGGSSSRFSGASFDNNGAAIVEDKSFMDCGEGVDSSDLRLPGSQYKLAQKLSALGKKIITIIIAGRPYDIEEINDKSKGLIMSFYPGIKGGKAIAEILFGKIAPSGRLPVSIPRNVGQLPVYYNYKASYKAMSYYDIPSKPLYTFGDGLTYTSFRYSEVIPSSRELSIEEFRQKGIELSFIIKNIGDVEAFAVPQAYIYDPEASVTRRVRELKAFKKLWIPLGEAREVTLRLTEEELSLWDGEMTFTLETGKFHWYLQDSGIEYSSGSFSIV